MPFILLFIAILLTIIRISAAIYIESNNSYQLLNSLFCLIKHKSIAKYKVSTYISLILIFYIFIFSDYNIFIAS